MSRTKSKAGRGPLLHPSDLSPPLCLTPSTSASSCRSLSVPAFLFQVEEAARDISRLRRRVTSDYDSHLVERLADRVEALDAVIWPTAGELVRDGLPVDNALARVDARAFELRRLLGRRSR
jgi:hypothetical protein